MSGFVRIAMVVTMTIAVSPALAAPPDGPATQPDQTSAAAPADTTHQPSGGSTSPPAPQKAGEGGSAALEQFTRSGGKTAQ